MKIDSQELRGLTHDQLYLKVVELRKRSLELVLNATTTHVKDFSSQRRHMRRSIARALTIQRERA
jgi:ribosomal protein L29